VHIYIKYYVIKKNNSDGWLIIPKTLSNITVSVCQLELKS